MNSKLYLPMLIGITLIVTFLSNVLLNTDELLFNSLSEQLTTDQIHGVIEFNKKWKWVGYIFIPVFLCIKISLIGSVLYMGLFFFNKQISYKRLFMIITKAEFVFIVMAIIKLIWFTIQDQYTLEDVQFFYPLSALNIIGQEGVSPWFIYPFQTLNLFELAYWFVLAYLLGKQIKISIDKALKIVASSYGSTLLIWVVIVMFFTLNAS